LKDKNGNPIPNADIIIYSKDVKMGVFETNEEGFWKIEDKSLFDQSTSYTLKYIDEKGNEQTLNLSAEEMIANKNAVRDAQNKVLKTTSFNISADRKKEAELTTDQNGQYKYDFNDNIDYEIEIKAIDYELKKVAFNIDQEDYEIERGKPQYDIKIDKSKSPKAKLEKIINPENEKVLFTLKDENGEPIPFADIAIYGKDIKIGTFESNEDGYWDIKDSSLYNFEGSYTIKYKDKNGIEQSIKIDGDEILSDNEALKDKNNQTISNTKFDVYSDREKLADITTDINGQYEYDFDDNIDYEIEIEAIDYELKKVEFVYEEDDFELDRGQPQYDLKIDKTEKATITKVTSPDNKNTLFTLRDSDGSPIPFADITIYGKDIKMGSFDTDEGGFWNINDTTKYNIDDDYTVKFIDKNGVTQTLQIKGKDILDTKQPLKDKNQEVISNTSFDLYANKEKLAELTTDKNGQYSYDFEEGINYEIEIDVIDYELQTIEFSFDGETDFDIDRGTAQYDIKIDKQSSIPKVAKATKEKEKATKEIQKPQLTSFENIYFDYNKSTLTKEGYSKLRKVVRYMKNNPTKRITIYGHTDAIGSSRYNEKLGLKRAKACEKYLNRKGVSGRISTVSAGKTKLINPCPDPADCSTEENRKNRRVEIFIQD
jgi:outer membrane protein OmpA-like peptidoglycan-associated protein